jgi:hypothetical protein
LHKWWFKTGEWPPVSGAARDGWSGSAEPERSGLVFSTASEGPRAILSFFPGPGPSLCRIWSGWHATPLNGMRELRISSVWFDYEPGKSGRLTGQREVVDTGGERKAVSLELYTARNFAKHHRRGQSPPLIRGGRPIPSITSPFATVNSTFCDGPARNFGNSAERGYRSI